MPRKNKRDKSYYTPLNTEDFHIAPSYTDVEGHGSSYENYPPLCDEQFGNENIGYSDVAYGSDTTTGSY